MKKRKIHPVVTTLRAIRQERNIRQAKLADDIGVSVEAVSQWETGTRVPTLFNFSCWAESLGVELVIREKSDAA